MITLQIHLSLITTYNLISFSVDTRYYYIKKRKGKLIQRCFSCKSKEEWGLESKEKVSKYIIALVETKAMDFSLV